MVAQAAVGGATPADASTWYAATITGDDHTSVVGLTSATDPVPTAAVNGDADQVARLGASAAEYVATCEAVTPEADQLAVALGALAANEAS